MQKMLIRSLVLATLWAVVGIAPALAQYNAGFEGVISDSSGAVVPGVKVVARNVATGVEYSATSNAAGVYHITNLPEGTYGLTAEKEGFATAQTEPLQLHTEELKGVNLTLNVGSVKQTVNVTEAAPLLNTEQAHLSEDIGYIEMDSLPMEGENPLTVVELVPGVVGATTGNSTIFTNANNSGVNANGTQTASNNYKVDGQTVTETPGGGTMNISPDLDEVAELHVTTNNFSADIGRSAGFQLDMSTKSGTNQFHGDVFYYGMTAALDANSFFSNMVPSTTGNAYKPRYDQNQFGATFGGPIKRDKAFFFISYSGLRQVGGSSLSSSPVGEFNEETPQFAQYVEQNFPNNISAKLLGAYPPAVAPWLNITTAANYSSYLEPNTAFPASLPVAGTAIYNLPSYATSDHYLVRFDDNLSQKDRLYASFMQTSPILTPQLGARTAFDYPYPNGDSFASATLDHTFSPTMLNEAKGGFSRTGAFVPGVLPQIPAIYSLEDGVAGFGMSDFEIPFGYFQMNYEWKDILTWYRGKHNLKMGVEGRRGHDDFQTVSRPAYYFLNILDFAADLPYEEGLLVNPSTGQPEGANYQYRTVEEALFIQDDFKVSPHFTLNLGLRWEDYGSPIDNFNTLGNFFPGSGSTYDEQVANGVMKGVHTPWSPKHLNFAPRLGYSWNPRPRLVLRGGFGITYDRFPNGDWESMGGLNPPNGAAFIGAGLPFNDSYPYYLGSATAPNWGFYGSPEFETGLNPQGGIKGARVGVYGALPNLAEPYVENWVQGVQYELSQNWMMEADYLGNAAHHLIWDRNVNRFPGDLIQNQGSFTGFNPAFTGIPLMFSDGNSSYNAFTFHVRHLLANSFSVDAVYNHSKAIDDNEGDAQILSNRSLEKGLASFNHAERFTAYATYHFPSLTNSDRYLRSVAGGWELSPVIVMQSGAPFTVSCGVPFIYGTNAAGNTTDVGGCNWIADGQNGNRPDNASFGNNKIPNLGFKSWLNGVFGNNPWGNGTIYNIFPQPALGTVGNLGRNTYTVPGFATVDLALRKTFNLHSERWKLEFRIDAFNLFNRVNLINVDTGMSDITFGQATGTLNSREMQLGMKLTF